METQTTEHLKIGTKLWKMSFNIKLKDYEPEEYKIVAVEINEKLKVIYTIREAKESRDYGGSSYTAEEISRIFAPTKEQLIIDLIKKLSNQLK